MAINNPNFKNDLRQIFPAGLAIKDTTVSSITAPYLDWLLSIKRVVISPQVIHEPP